MRFKFIDNYHISMEHYHDGKFYHDDVIYNLNDLFSNMWVFIENTRDAEMNGVFYVKDYKFQRENIEIFMNVTKRGSLDSNIKIKSMGIWLKEHVDGINIKTYDDKDVLDISQHDIIYRLEEMKEEETLTKIRWWKDGKLGNKKTVESEFNRFKKNI